MTQTAILQAVTFPWRNENPWRNEKVTNLTLGRQICGNWDGAAGYEWLVTNGLGGYACGTVALANTRRYHGFLMASLKPPVQRTLLVAKIDLSVEYLGRKTDLFANEFADGTISPQGFIHLESFALLDGIPTWRYTIADALLQQQIFMAQGANTSYLRLELIRSSSPMRVTLKPFVTYRDYHSLGSGPQPFQLDSGADHCAIQAFAGARPYRLMVSHGEFTAAPEWYWKFWHREEAQRGLDAAEDLFFPGSFGADLTPELALFFTATAEPSTPAAGAEQVSAPAPGGSTRRLPLGTIIGARSGDKGGNANLGVWTWDDQAYAWLCAYLDTERLRTLIPEAAGLEVIKRHHDFLARAHHGRLQRLSPSIPAASR